MAATRADISGWFDESVDLGATHMVVVVDEFDLEDFPVPIMPSDDVQEVVKKYTDMDLYRVMEVYRLDMDKETQLNEMRAFNY